MRVFWILLYLFSGLFVRAQHKITIRISTLPAVTPANIFIAGSFNNWNPADASFKLQKDDSGYFYESSSFRTGSYEFKFTSGSWATVETSGKGNDIQNRRFEVRSDSIFHFTIEGWKSKMEERQHTTSPNVLIIDTAFYIPQLKRTRRVWAYLPAEYNESKKYYPVLYMHDGQNLFDDFTAYSGEWGVDETLDELKANCIVIGIDNGGAKRMNEYNVNTSPQFGKGEGKRYLEFIVKTLKPYIDKKYRTLAGRQSTFMAGSSMGGLITFYAGLYYPETFGGLGIFSPSFAIAPQAAIQAESLMKAKKRPGQKWFFYTGGAESESMVSEMLNIFRIVHRYNKTGMRAVIRAEGQHNEARWRLEFPDFYRWLIGAVRE